jgi:hypothetical protein
MEVPDKVLVCHPVCQLALDGVAFSCASLSISSVQIAKIIYYS